VKKKNPDAPYWIATETYQRRLIENALRATGGRVDKAAEQLGIDRTYLFKKIKEFGIDRKLCKD
jgi:DNA-binding NtrC family response regulator